MLLLLAHTLQSPPQTVPYYATHYSQDSSFVF